MDRLAVRLNPYGAKDLGSWTAVELLVNGRDLKNLVEEFEQSKHYEPAGGYDSISLDGLQPARDRLTGEPNSLPGNGEVVLLVCEGCREEGCWPLFARVQMSQAVVEWSGMRQPHRPDRDYSELQFTFDRQQYDAALDFRADVAELAVPVWILDGEHELRGRRELAHEWFAQLSAPHKEMVTYTDAGHSVVFEQADAFHRLMVGEIVPATYGR